MKKLLLSLSTVALCFQLVWAGDVFPLVQMKREAVEGMFWDLTPVTLGSQSYSGSLQGMGSQRNTGIGYELNGEWELLEAHIGYLKNVSPKRSCRFVVTADGEQIYRSEEIKGGQEPELLRVPVVGKKIVLLSIEPVSYGGTLGACYGAPVVKRGLKPEEMATPYRVEINGTRVPFESYAAPSVLPISLPVKPGESTYQVKVVHDPKERRIQITTTP